VSKIHMVNLILLFMVPSMPKGNIIAEVKTMPRIKKIKNFPCSKCHKNKKRNFQISLPLNSPHNEIVFNHMPSINSCYQCHSKNNIKGLILRDGRKLSLSNSNQLCWQCHGEIKNDWRTGLHGKETGSWLTTKYRYSCIECHEAHSPRPHSMKAEPSIQRPKFGITKQEH